MAKTDLIKGVSPVKVGPALWSLRHGGHDFTSALCEVIDNSFGHGDASLASIKLEWSPRTDKRLKERLSAVYIADNGVGMDPERLCECLVLGYSTTYNKREGIGRFGFGMTQGAIGQCKKIEVYSKTKNTDIHYVVLDLDDFIPGQEKKSEIDPPIKKKVPKEYEELLEKHGTLVIWTKLDRIEAFDSKEDLDKLHYDVGRIYRKFIGIEIIENDKAIPNPKRREITINGKIVNPLDPLYYTKIPGFEQDPRSELLKQIVIEDWPVHPSELQDDIKTKTGNILIRISLLPKEFRPESGSGGFEEAKRRHIHQNEGISILRMDREVYYESIRGIGPLTYDPRDRWWGMEISFPPILDSWFSIKTVKKGASPLDELKEEIDKRVNSTINRCRDIVGKYWKDKKDEKKQKDAEDIEVTGHERAEENFKKAGIGKSKFSDQLSPEEKNRTADEIIRRFAKTAEAIEAIKTRFNNLNIKWFNAFDVSEDGTFVDINPKGGTTALTYNQKHPFFQELYNIYERLEKLQSIEDPKQWIMAKKELSSLIADIKYAVDALLGSYAASVVGFRPDEVQKVKDTLLLLLVNWGTYLKVVSDDEFATNGR